MALDPDLVRQLLQHIQEYQEADGTRVLNIEIVGHTPEVISNHLCLMYQAGLIDALDCSNKHREDWHATRLTGAGHLFLHITRHRRLWEKAKWIAMDHSGEMTLAVLDQVVFQQLAAKRKQPPL